MRNKFKPDVKTSRLKAANKLSIAQKVAALNGKWRLGEIHSIDLTGVCTVFVKWDGKETPYPECPELLIPEDRFDRTSELQIYHLLDDGQNWEDWAIAEKLDLDLSVVEEDLDRLKDKRLVLWTGGLWKHDRKDAVAEFASVASDSAGLSEKQKAALERMAAKAAASESADRLALEEILYLCLDEIRIDGGTQARVNFNHAHLRILIEGLLEGVELEPLVVYHDGESYWLADGFHRLGAYRSSHREVIPCRIVAGTQREAVLYAVGANAEHKTALRRSNADKQNAVSILLNDPEWQQWSDREIAKVCKVSHTFVSKIRSDCASGNVARCKPQTTTFRRNGKEVEMRERIKYGDRVRYGERFALVLSSDRNDCRLAFEDGEIAKFDKRQLALAPTDPKIKDCSIVSIDEKEYYYHYSADGFEVLQSVEDPDKIERLPTEFLRKILESPPPSPVKISTEEICIAVASNLDRFTSEELLFLKETIDAKIGNS